MTKRLVDTSVVAKWAIVEEDSDLAFALFGTDLAAPDVLHAELGNVLWKKVRRGQITPEHALASFAEVRSQLDFLPTKGLETRALEIAFAIDHPVYDCFFLAVAEATELTLITADRGLVRSCANTDFAALLEPLA